MRIKNKKILSYFLLIIVLMNSMPISASNMKQIKDLPVGSIVYDLSWKWEHKYGDNYTGTSYRESVEWIIVAKNHRDYPSNSATLISKNLVARYRFDSMSRYWHESDLNNFLNGTFLNSFSSSFKESVLTTTLPINTPSGRKEFRGKVFIPSSIEMGIPYGSSDGSRLEYFDNNDKRKTNTIGGFDAGYSRYLTRTYSERDPSTFIIISSIYGNDTGSIPSNQPDYIRPLLNIKSDTMVKQVGSRWEIVYTMPDTTGPNITLTPSTTNKTNKDVVINVVASDPTISGAETSGVKRIQRPDGSWINGSSASYTVKSNGSYQFKAEDNAGNISTKSITISNINKESPVITIEPYNSEWTNKDITVKATTNKGSINEISYKFTSNGSFTFIATDDYGNTSNKTVTITNIDKTPPKININIKR